MRLAVTTFNVILATVDSINLHFTILLSRRLNNPRYSNLNQVELKYHHTDLLKLRINFQITTNPNHGAVCYGKVPGSQRRSFRACSVLDILPKQGPPPGSRVLVVG
ncbi:hypothetical protein C8F04DRAFT_1196047 [Mycena alexandri]|uniref:Uncharacterized protein n=1 Tax=Mycena alexandri TaxID=1745969 RepID=A0AAD6S4G8_9AGAR|nr:hypothetical protein C8F04DRAFT_1196047 [Mycena alexandri]